MWVVLSVRRLWGACLVPRTVSVCRFVWSGVGGGAKSAGLMTSPFPLGFGERHVEQTGLFSCFPTPQMAARARLQSERKALRQDRTWIRNPQNTRGFEAKPQLLPDGTQNLMVPSPHFSKIMSAALLTATPLPCKLP